MVMQRLLLFRLRSTEGGKRNAAGRRVVLVLKQEA
jgi:hypothetical protein